MELTANQIQKYKIYPQSELKKKAVLYFNKYIRLRDQEDRAFICCSCNHMKPTKLMHAGHYHSAGHNGAIEFDERNVNGQCSHCNTFLHGNLIGYQKFMLKRYGQHIIDELEIKRNLPFKPDRFYFIGIIIEYTEKVKNLTK